MSDLSPYKANLVLLIVILVVMLVGAQVLIGKTWFRFGFRYRVIRRKEEPGAFWLVIGLEVAMIVAFTIIGIKT